jgi:hypothetical protein
MKMLISLVKGAICVFWMLVLAGCGQPMQPATTPHTTLTKPPTFITHLPIPDETETETPVPTSSPVLSLLLSVTPLPTLSPNEHENYVVELLSNNGGCNLPCWWGISPAKTSWDEVWRVLSQFDPEPYVTDTYTKEYPLGRQIAYFLIPVSESISTSQSIHITLRITNNIIRTISIYPIEQANNFRLPRFLADYGQPSEVWIHTYRSYLGGIPPADVLFFYPEKGILARYSTSLTQINESQDTANICLDSTPSLDLWSPDEIIDFDQAQDLAWLDYKKYDKPLLPLDKAAGISIEQLYNQRTSERICITTKLSLWPEP